MFHDCFPVWGEIANFAFMKRFSSRHVTAAWMFAAFAMLALLACSGCSSGKTVRRDRAPSVDAGVYIKGKHVNRKQARMIEEACSWIGTPYKYGGAEKGIGTDCSGIVLRVYLDMTEIKLPRNSAKQAEFCKRIKAKDARPCDLVFFATGKDPGKVSHVGLLLDSENFLHASSSKGVTITRLDNPWWSPRILGFGRVPGF